MTWYGNIPSADRWDYEVTGDPGPGTSPDIYERLVATRIYYDGPVNGAVHGILLGVWHEQALEDIPSGVSISVQLYDHDGVNDRPGSALGVWTVSGDPQWPDHYANGSLFLPDFTWTSGSGMPASGAYYWVVVQWTVTEGAPRSMFFQTQDSAEFGAYTDVRLVATGWSTPDTVTDGFAAAFTDQAHSASDTVEAYQVNQMALTSYDSDNKIQARQVSQMALTSYDDDNKIQVRQVALMVLRSTANAATPSIWINHHKSPPP